MKIENLEIRDEIEATGWSKCARFNVGVPGLMLKHWVLISRGDSFAVVPPRTKIEGEILRTVEFLSDDSKAEITLAAVREYLRAGGKRQAEGRAYRDRMIAQNPSITLAGRAHQLGHGSEAVRATLALIDRDELPMPRPRPARVQ